MLGLVDRVCVWYVAIQFVPCVIQSTEAPVLNNGQRLKDAAE